MEPFVVMVDFRLKPGAGERFAPLIAENARLSVRDEAGCRRFDVVQPRAEPDRVLLYEIYDDEAAFAAHLATPHFMRFDRACAALVEGREIVRGDLVAEG